MFAPPPLRWSLSSLWPASRCQFDQHNAPCFLAANNNNNNIPRLYAFLSRQVVWLNEFQGVEDKPIRH
jgi:hypothetical protein